MSIFGTSEKKEGVDNNFVFPIQNTIAAHSTFISEDLEIKGNIVGKDYIELNGKVTGTLKSNKIDIRPKGIVNGEVSADILTVEGTLDGEIITDDLYIRSTARIKGVIKYKNLDIQPGAIITAEFIKI